MNEPEVIVECEECGHAIKVVGHPAEARAEAAESRVRVAENRWDTAEEIAKEHWAKLERVRKLEGYGDDLADEWWRARIADILGGE